MSGNVNAELLEFGEPGEVGRSRPVRGGFFFSLREIVVRSDDGERSIKESHGVEGLRQCTGGGGWGGLYTRGDG